MGPEELDRLLGEVGDERLAEALAGFAEFHRAAFERILAILREAGRADLIDRFLQDPVLESVLRGYRLVEVDVLTKVRQAVESVRPYLRGRGGDVLVVGVRDNTAELELIGSGGLGEMQTALRTALYEQVPELAALRIGGVTVPLDSRRWIPMLHRNEIREGACAKVSVFEREILLCAVQNRVFAFADRCPADGGSLESGSLAQFILTCPCHGYGFDLRSGACIQVPALQLETFPVMLESGLVRVGL